MAIAVTVRDHFEFRIIGNPGIYHVETSADLVTWKYLISAEIKDGATTSISHRGSAQETYRFFRIVRQP